MRATETTVATRIYIGVGALLLVVSLTLGTALGPHSYYIVAFVSAIALLSLVLGRLQPCLGSPDRWKSIAALTYGLGVVLVAGASPMLDVLYSARVDSLSEEQLESDLVLLLFRGEILIPALLFVPVLLTFVGLLRSESEGGMARRIYIVGGTFMVLLLLGRVWYSFFAKWFVATSGGIGNVTAGLVSYPIFLLLALGGILLGLMPDGTHLKGRVATLGAIGYLLGTGLYSIGIHLAVWPGSDVSVPLGTIGLLLVSAPYLVVAGRSLKRDAAVV